MSTLHLFTVKKNPDIFIGLIIFINLTFRAPFSIVVLNQKLF